jgi:hypothetical protein
MSTLLYLIPAIFVLAAMAFVVSLFWAATGSPDVNGDPERDAGQIDDEPKPQMVLCMDCGHIIRHGTKPASHGICIHCVQRRRAHRNAETFSLKPSH